MSEWITHRRPTKEDADTIGSVWATYNGEVHRWDYQGVDAEMAWMPITKPEPYVKPSRFEIYGAVGGWQVWGVRDNKGFDIIGFISRDHAKQAIKQLEKVTQ